MLLITSHLIKSHLNNRLKRIQKLTRLQKPKTKTQENMSTSDWRIKLFGESILINDHEEGARADVEAGINLPKGVDAIPTVSKPTKEYFEGYDYIAVFFG